MLEPILIVGIVMAGTAWYVQHKWRRRVRAMAEMRDAARNTSGLELLARRYARGEIDRDEYLAEARRYSGRARHTAKPALNRLHSRLSAAVLEPPCRALEEAKHGDRANGR